MLLNHGSSPQSEEEAIFLAGDVRNSQRLNRSNEDIDVDEPMTHLQGAIMQHREEKRLQTRAEPIVVSAEYEKLL